MGETPSVLHCTFKLKASTTIRDIFDSQYTVNLTPNPLSQPTLDLLDLGLTFIPTVRLLDPLVTRADQKYVARRVRLIDYFHFHGSNEEPIANDFRKQFTSKSNWTPQDFQISTPTLNTLHNICDITQNRLAGTYTEVNKTLFIKNKVRANISPEQISTIRQLKANHDIIIKSADKGSSVVVMRTEAYRQEALRQLSNNQYYRPLANALYPDTAKAIFHTLEALCRAGAITAKQLAYLKPKPNELSSRYFYLLPKIHKPRPSWPQPDMPPGRPIVADVETESSRVCSLIDHFLQPLSIRHPSYLKDTYDFINKIRNTEVRETDLLISADVESLYTNMRIDLILSSVREIFRLYPDPARPDEGIIRLLELTLNNNDFEFDGKFYLQICGIAMGRKYAPSAANIYLREFDRRAMNGYHIRPKLYSRFLDDIFGVWPGTREELLNYQEFLNNLIPGIKVTFTVRDWVIEFLDTHVYKHKDSTGKYTLQTKLYSKPTDTHQLLHRSSYHPTHTFKGIAKSQFIRFKRISSSYRDYAQAAAMLLSALRTRGYNIASLRQLKSYIWHKYDIHKTRDTATPKKEVLPVITHYDSFHATLNKQWAACIRSNAVFDETRVISAFRRHKNLKDLLVRGRFGQVQDPEESDPEALLDALILVLNRDHAATDSAVNTTT